MVEFVLSRYRDRCAAVESLASIGTVSEGIQINNYPCEFVRIELKVGVHLLQGIGKGWHCLIGPKVTVAAPFWRRSLG